MSHGSSLAVRSRTAGLVAAAGEGARLGQGPKAFIPLAGFTLLQRSVAALSQVAREVIVAVPAGELERAQRLVPHARVIVGGSTRQESVFALLQEISAELVLIHDVARPFLERSVAQRVCEAAAGSGAATAARRVADTLVRHSDGATVDREALRAVQTPQGFRRSLLLEAHHQARREGRSATDDAALVRAIGKRVELVEGSPWLFKLTTAFDLAFAEALAPHWDAGGNGS